MNQKDRDYLLNLYPKMTDDYHKCFKCSDANHEGPNRQFCLCEERNIRIAKEKRRREERVWYGMEAIDSQQTLDT